MRENLPDITHERAMPVNSPLISLPQAADSFSLRAKSRLRRLRFDTRLRAQPLGGSCQRPRPLTDEGQVCHYNP